MAQGQERGASGRTQPMLRVGSIRGLHPQPPERLPKGQIFLVRVPHPHPRGSSDLTDGVPSSLTFLKPIPEGARSTHCSALLIQRHGAVPEAAVRVRLVLAIGIGQAVGPQHRWVGQAHLGDSGGTRELGEVESCSRGRNDTRARGKG